MVSKAQYMLGNERVGQRSLMHKMHSRLRVQGRKSEESGGGNQNLADSGLIIVWSSPDYDMSPHTTATPESKKTSKRETYLETKWGAKEKASSSV